MSASLYAARYPGLVMESVARSTYVAPVVAAKAMYAPSCAVRVHVCMCVRTQVCAHA